MSGTAESEASDFFKHAVNVFYEENNGNQNDNHIENDANNKADESRRKKINLRFLSVQERMKYRGTTEEKVSFGDVNGSIINHVDGDVCLFSPKSVMDDVREERGGKKCLDENFSAISSSFYDRTFLRCSSTHNENASNKADGKGSYDNHSCNDATQSSDTNTLRIMTITERSKKNERFLNESRRIELDMTTFTYINKNDSSGRIQTSRKNNQSIDRRIHEENGNITESTEIGKSLKDVSFIDVSSDSAMLKRKRCVTFDDSSYISEHYEDTILESKYFTQSQSRLSNDLPKEWSFQGIGKPDEKTGDNFMAKLEWVYDQVCDPCDDITDHFINWVEAGEEMTEICCTHNFPEIFEERTRMIYACTYIQAIYRSYSTRVVYIQLIVDIVACQSIVRRKLAIKKLKELRHCYLVKREYAVTVIQSIARRHFQRLKYSKAVNSIIMCQSVIRRKISKRKLQDLREKMAATKIISSFRRYVDRMDFLFIIKQIILCQSAIRRKFARESFEDRRRIKLEKAATKIQNFYRGYEERMNTITRSIVITILPQAEDREAHFYYEKGEDKYRNYQMNNIAAEFSKSAAILREVHIVEVGSSSITSQGLTEDIDSEHSMKDFKDLKSKCLLNQNRDHFTMSDDLDIQLVESEQWIYEGMNDPDENVAECLFSGFQWICEQICDPSMITTELSLEISEEAESYCLYSFSETAQEERNRKKPRETSACTCIQAIYRGHLSRVLYRQIIADIIICQSITRRMIAMKMFKVFSLLSWTNNQVAVTKIQCVYRGYLQRLIFNTTVNRIIWCQSARRRMIAMQKVQKQTEDESVIKIQAVYRRFKNRIHFVTTEKSVALCQSTIWDRVAIYRLKLKQHIKFNVAASNIQKVLRGYVQRKRHSKLISDIIFWQRMRRRIIFFRKLQNLRAILSALKIQCIFRGYVTRKTHVNAKNKIKLLQNVLQNTLNEKRIIETRNMYQREATTKIKSVFQGCNEKLLCCVGLKCVTICQSNIRRMMAKIKVQNMRKEGAVTKIQSVLRGYITRINYLAMDTKLRRGNVEKRHPKLRVKELKHKGHDNSASKIQSFFRMYLQRQRNVSLLSSILLLQRLIKRSFKMKKISELKQAVSARKIQSSFRRYTNRIKCINQMESNRLCQRVIWRSITKQRQSQYIKWEVAAIKIQRVFRLFLKKQIPVGVMKSVQQCQSIRRQLATNLLSQKLREDVMATKIQTAFRGHFCKLSYLRTVRRIVSFQNVIRMKFVEQRLKEWIHRPCEVAASKIQNFLQGYPQILNDICKLSIIVYCQCLMRRKICKRKTKEFQAALKIQHAFRGHANWIKYKMSMRGIIVCQSGMRGTFTEQREEIKYFRQVISASKIQQVFRGHCHNLRNKILLKTIISCQSIIRQAILISKSNKLRIERLAMKIQAAFRRYACKSKYNRTIRGIMSFQSLMRKRSTKQKVEEWIFKRNEIAASKIQQLFRWICVRATKSIVLCQFLIRRKIFKRKLKEFQAAAKIQHAFRGHVNWIKYKMSVRDVIACQNGMKSTLTVQRLEEIKQLISATKIQQVFRRYWHKLKNEVLLKTIISRQNIMWRAILMNKIDKLRIERLAMKIQAAFRKHTCKSKYNRTIRGIMIIQSIIKKKYTTLNRAAFLLTRVVKGYCQRLIHIKTIKSIALCQHLMRKRINTRNVTDFHMEESAAKNQRVFLHYSNQIIYKPYTKELAVITIQRAYRGHMNALKSCSVVRRIIAKYEESALRSLQRKTAATNLQNTHHSLSPQTQCSALIRNHIPSQGSIVCGLLKHNMIEKENGIKSIACDERKNFSFYQFLIHQFIASWINEVLHLKKCTDGVSIIQVTWRKWKYGDRIENRDTLTDEFNDYKYKAQQRRRVTSSQKKDWRYTKYSKNHFLAAVKIQSAWRLLFWQKTIMIEDKLCNVAIQEYHVSRQWVLLKSIKQFNLRNNKLTGWNHYQTAASIFIQRVFRGYSSRMKYATTIADIIVIQSFIRCKNAIRKAEHFRFKVARKLYGITKIQSILRGYIQRICFTVAMKSIILCQCAIRRMIAKQRVESLHLYNKQRQKTAIEAIKTAVKDALREDAQCQVSSASSRSVVVVVLPEVEDGENIKLSEKTVNCKLKWGDSLVDGSRTSHSKRERSDEDVYVVEVGSSATISMRHQHQVLFKQIPDDTEDLTLEEKCLKSSKMSTCGLSDELHDILIQSGKWFYEKIGDPDQETAENLLTVMEIGEETASCLWAAPKRT